MYTFGPFSLDDEARLLLRDGEPVPLTGKVLDTLTVLVQNHGRVTDKELLLATLWPDTVVEEANLTQNISTLRKVLGDNPKQHQYIATIQGRGYSFVAPVTEHPAATRPAACASEPTRFTAPADSDPTAREIESAVAPARPKLISSRPWLVIAFLSSLVIAVLAWWYSVRHAEVVERKLTTNSSENSVSGMAISPDGRHLAYADNTGIFLKVIRNGETHRVALPANFSAGVDDWFPDGSHLLVSRADQPGKASLWVVSVFGGAPRQLTEDASGGAVSPDGTQIAFRRGALTYDGLWGQEEWIMRSDGTHMVKVASYRSDASQVGIPTWSPDGKRIAYIRSNWAYNARTSAIEVNEWQKATSETIFSDSRLSPALHWLPDDRLIYAFGSAQRQQDSSLWIVALQQSGRISSPPKRIAEGHGWISRVTAGRDGKHVIFLRGNWLPSVYVATLAADGGSLLAHTRLTLDENENIPWSWTPDSKAVLFSSDRNGTREIFRQAIDQPLAESLVTSEDHVSQPRITPDGSEIVYISVPKSAGADTLSSIFATPIRGGTPRLVLKDHRICNLQCARLPSRICLYTIAKGPTWETFRFDVRSGKSEGAPQIDPPSNWSLSPDGSERAIVVFGFDVNKIQFRSTSTGKTRGVVVNGWGGLMGAGWSANGRRLLVSWHDFDRDSALLSVTPDGKASVLLKSSNPEVWAAIPSPNGQMLAIAEAGGSKNVWQIENF